MKHLIKVFSVYFIILIICILEVSFRTVEKNVGKAEPVIITKERNFLYSNYEYNLIIEYIKSHEGFVDTIYLCPANICTIGYGHVILKHEKFNTPISENHAFKLLKKDFELSLYYARTMTNLKGKKLLAIAHFIYCFGSYKFSKSTLYKNIQNNKPIDNEIVKWVKINGVKSKVLLKQRLFELNLYNS
jgi:lysozyme